jgi:hypothetical protein
MIWLPDTTDARAVQDRRRLEICSEVESLIATVRDEHPDVHITELPRHLPEPQRTQLVELLAEAADWMQFPSHEDSHE